MELSLLNTEISKKVIKPTYIFVGPETALRDIYISKLMEAGNLTSKRYFDSLREALTAPEFNLLNQKYLYIVKDEKELLSSEKLIKAFKEYKKASTPIIVYFTTLDKRKAFYKEFESNIIWFNKLDTKQLIKYAKTLIDGETEGFYKTFIEVCGNDMGRMKLEADKIVTYGSVYNMPYRKIFEKFVNEGLIFSESEEVNFQFANDVLFGKAHRVFQLLENIDPVDNIRILSLLYTIFRQHYLVRSYNGNGKVSDETGVPVFAVSNIKNNTPYFTMSELQLALRIIPQTIYGIKNGLIDNDFALKYVLAYLL